MKYLLLWFSMSSLAASPHEHMDVQEPVLRPVSTYLLKSNVTTGDRRYAARRCSALYSILSAKMGDRGDTASVRLLDRSGELMYMVAREADIMLGSKESEVDEIEVRAISDVLLVLNDRMKRNMAVLGSYLAGDDLLESDAKVCRTFVESVSANPNPSRK